MREHPRHFKHSRWSLTSEEEYDWNGNGYSPQCFSLGKQRAVLHHQTEWLRKMPRGMPTVHIRMPAFESWLYSWFQPLANVHPGRQWWWLKRLECCHTCERPGLSFLAESFGVAQPWLFLVFGEWAGRWARSLSDFVSVPFKLNKKNKFLEKQLIRSKGL